MDYTKIKELIFKLLKEKYPSSFESFSATFGNVTISWSKDADYTINRKPFDSDDLEHGPAIMICIPEKSCSAFGAWPLHIPLTNKEFLELQLILEEVYPNSAGDFVALAPLVYNVSTASVNVRILS